MLMEDVRMKEGLHSCMNCGVCTGVCPAAEFYNYDPRQIVSIVQTRDDETIERLLKSDTIWYCGECMSCRPRCPRGNTPGYVIQALRTLSQKLGFFVESEKGRQQLALKRIIGENILRTGYCIVPRLVKPDLHPEQGTVWKWIYDPLNGILNWILKSLDLIEKNIMWTGDKRYALWAILIILITTSVGQPIILYIASLGNVPKDYVEAAQVDGANDFQVFWKIKWPSLLPTTLYIVVITTINSFQCFSLIQLLTSGGPNYRTTTIMYYLYETAFKKFEYGYANAMGVILALIIGFISFVQFKALGSDVEY